MKGTASSDDERLIPNIDIINKHKNNDKKCIDDGHNEYWQDNVKYRWWLIYFIGAVMVYSVRSSMSVCIAAISTEMGWSKNISGMALSAFFVGYVLTNILGGYFADRHGGERMIIYSVTLWGTLTLMLPYFSHSDTFMYSGSFGILAVRFLTGCGQGFFFPSFTTVTTKRVAVSDRGMFVGFVMSGCAVGTILIGFIGSILIEKSGWQSVFVCVGILSLIWVCIYRYYYTITTCSDGCFKVEKPSLKQSKISLRFAAKKPAIWAFMICMFCNGYAFYNLLSWTPVYFHDAFPKSKGWVFNVVPWLGSFIIQNVSGYCANNLLASGFTVNFVRKLYAAVLFLGTMIFSLLLNTVENFHQALFIMTLTVGVGGFNSCSITMTPQDLLPTQSGALFGVGNMLSALGGTIGVYFTGYILDITGHWSFVFCINAIVSLFAFLIFQIFGSGEPI